jgi:crotonobetainyl-CoA:carnitine CoA-transferase CaiB-like acyl-CoA transferase
MTMDAPTAPLAGLRVVEVSLGPSLLGAGLAASLPGALLRDFGADVTSVRPLRPSTLDRGVEFARVWDRGKEIIEVDADSGRAAQTIAGLALEADILFMTGREEALEGRGLEYHELSRSNPGLINVRVRPSRIASGTMPDFELLVHARAGLLTQLRGHRSGPVFCDLAVAGAGAALSATVGALACLYEREATGMGGWVETSLYDGLLSLLRQIIGRVQHSTAATTLLWEEQGPAEAWSYRCADGGFIQLWFGAKGAYEAFLQHMKEPPSASGYMADLVSGALVARSAGWAKSFATHERSWWLENLAGHPFRAEPVWRPGEALLDRHVREVGLSIDHEDPDLGRIITLGPVGNVTAVKASGADLPLRVSPQSPRLLSGIRVLDLSAYLAGPIMPWILAELGAEVIKVEPLTGDTHRSMEPMFAAGQRSKRSVGLDLKAGDASLVLERMFRWTDVVHQNSRLGLAERLGYHEDVVRAANPEVVYSFASGFGVTGPRASLAANDYLMQALSGIEAAQGGHGQPPSFLMWGAVDVASGWVSAGAVIAALYARRRTGHGQSVQTSLLGSALLLKSGSFCSGIATVEGPRLDRAQTGYGATYRIYRCRDSAWLALVVPDLRAWQRLRDVVGLEGLPAGPPPVCTGGEQAEPSETLLEQAFATRDASLWVGKLQAAGVPAERVVEADRREFIARILDDPVNYQLGRISHVNWDALGLLEQPAFPLRFGPTARPAPPPFFPRLGEHTVEVLQSLGFGVDEISRLAASGAIRLESEATATAGP